LDYVADKRGGNILEEEILAMQLKCFKENPLQMDGPPFS